MKAAWVSVFCGVALFLCSTWASSIRCSNGKVDLRSRSSEVEAQVQHGSPRSEESYAFGPRQAPRDSTSKRLQLTWRQRLRNRYRQDSQEPVVEGAAPLSGRC